MYRTKNLLLVFAAMALAVSVAVAGPISSFERMKEGGVYEASGAKLERVKEHATDGEYAAKVVFPGSEKDSWPGVNVPIEGVKLGDAQALLVDVQNPSDAKQALGYRIDTKDKVRIFGSHTLKAGENVFKVPFSKAKPEQVGQEVSRVFVYVRKPRKDVTLYLDNMRVEAE